MAITKNIVTDYACPTNGTSDCRPAFLAFKADAAGQTATLNIPAGTYTFDVQSNFPEDVYIFAGIPNLTVNATGVTFKRGTGGIWLGARSMSGLANTFAKIDTVIPGATQVKCKTVAEASNFVVGQYVALTGLATQGNWSTSFGFPPNVHYFEYLRVASVNGTTGIVTFDTAVTKTYKDYWPEYGQGALPFQGGPATIYKMGSDWDCVHVYNGGTFEAPSVAINCAGRDITFNNHVQSGFGINPSQNQTMRFIDSTLAFTEVDKLIGTFYYGGTTTASQTHLQSSSVDLFWLSGTSNVSIVNGTPRSLRADPGTTIGALTVGASYGRTDSIYFDSATISSVTTPSGVVDKGPSDAGINVGYSMANGVITVPNTAGAISWAVPGNQMYWCNDSFGTETAFKIFDVTQDATNIYIQTNMSGGFPSVPLSSGKLYVRKHPALAATFINCTGCAEVVDWSQFGTIPFASRSRRTYTKTLTTTSDNIHVPGKVVSITYTVNTAFAGTQNPLMLKAAAFDNVKTLGPPTSYTAADYGPKIDLRTPGTRTITASGVSPPGGRGADSNLTLPDANTWLTGTYSPTCSSDVSADPSNFSVTVEIVTDQGVFPPAVVPLWLRLRAV